MADQTTAPPDGGVDETSKPIQPTPLEQQPVDLLHEIIAMGPYKRSASFARFAAAMARAQREFPPIEKTKTAHVKLQGGGGYDYDYADLADVLNTIRPVLAQHGIAVFQPLGGTGVQSITATTLLVHESGEWISSELPMPVGGKALPQEVGSAIAYARRYGFTSMTGCAPTGEDDDGARASEEPRQQRGGARREQQQQQPRERSQDRQLRDAPSGDDQPSTVDTSAAADPTDTRPIVDAQVKRLRRIIREHAPSGTAPAAHEKAVAAYLRETYRIGKYEDIQRKDYDAIVAFAQSGTAPTAEPANVPQTELPMSE